MAKKLISKIISKLPAKNGAQKKSPAKPRYPKLPQLKYVFFIVDWQYSKIVSGALEEEKVRYYFVGKGMGTADSKTLDLLGIGAGGKAVITCLEQAVLVPVLMKEVRKKLKHTSPGAGISFSIPLSAINDPFMLIFKQSIYKNEKIPAEASAIPKSKGGYMAKEFSHDLIMAVINHGFSDEVMKTALTSGATGGTILQARGQAHQGAVKFFGVSVQDEKEIIIILTSAEKKVNIMRAVSEAHGLNSQAQGMIFSLPVDNVMGLNFDE